MIFKWDRFYPSGGMEDFVDSCEYKNGSLLQARKLLRDECDGSGGFSGVYDTETMGWVKVYYMHMHGAQMEEENVKDGRWVG